ncbi:hypothetical protein NC653_018028 [Populus alba x Populus x berolinensis]|uniref:Conserved oligomeric Golgi complex subunit 8 n=1 Tax=Populus alba x Populus x berolinensis TaxID=444605 RepID=A0AAD6W1Z5_9ROSI|nr:hypothetical protein NC653_018028 [Populus alba x Populus x berolinensis]
MNQTLLANHSTLLDLLEIPQLMGHLRHFLEGEFCLPFGKTVMGGVVSNGNYDDALDLETFVLLTLNHAPPNVASHGLLVILEDLDQRNAYEYLKGMINCHRTHLFDVVNQYRAIFADDNLRERSKIMMITSHLKTLKHSCSQKINRGRVSVKYSRLMHGQFLIYSLRKNMNTAVENFSASFGFQSLGSITSSWFSII